MPDGMRSHAFATRIEPLSYRKDTRDRLPLLSLPQRRSLLAPADGAPLSPRTRRRRREGENRLRAAQFVDSRNGCSCTQGLCGTSCECFQAGIACCQPGEDRGCFSACSCSYSGSYCGNSPRRLAAAARQRDVTDFELTSHRQQYSAFLKAKTVFRDRLEILGYRNGRPVFNLKDLGETVPAGGFLFEFK